MKAFLEIVVKELRKKGKGLPVVLRRLDEKSYPDLNPRWNEGRGVPV
jgi:hypothetical protein